MPTVLFIEHDHVSPPGLLGEAFEKCGWDVAEFLVVPPESFDSPAIDVRLPDPRHYDAVVLLGAPWSVYDETLQERWVGEEIGLARQADAEGIPVIGVCFGGQLLAAAHGGRVERAACAEVGWTRIHSCVPEFIPEGPWLQWHQDRWHTPAGAAELAHSLVAPQAFMLRANLAVQFHPEADETEVALWLEAGGADYVRRHNLDPDELLRITRREQARAAQCTEKLLKGYFERVRDLNRR